MCLGYNYRARAQQLGPRSLARAELKLKIKLKIKMKPDPKNFHSTLKQIELRLAAVLAIKDERQNSAVCAQCYKKPTYISHRDTLERE